LFNEEDANIFEPWTTNNLGAARNSKDGDAYRFRVILSYSYVNDDITVDQSPEPISVPPSYGKKPPASFF